MSDAGAAPGQKVVTELKVTGHLMTLDTGLFCIYPAPGATAPDPSSGLPGVRITIPPGSTHANGMVHIAGFRDDGWVSGQLDGALIRVNHGPAQILVTVYQAPGGMDPPRLQVLRLTEAAAGTPAAAPPPPAPAPAPAGEAAPSEVPAPAGPAEISAHVQRRGDVLGRVGDWIGDRGSKRWIEGFAIKPEAEVSPEDIEYQAVLGRGWLSPWAEGGQFCGSRGMALPILGLRVRLRGAAAATHECVVAASFVDGTSVGPVTNGEACETESLAPLEAFQVAIRRRAEASTRTSGRRAEATRPQPAAAARRDR
jgi:hypothetical protein